MAIVDIDLDWFRCPKGYQFARASDIALARSEDPKSYPDVDWIVPNSEERVSYRPLDNNDMVCVIFSHVRTPESLFEFINRHGPLTRSSPSWGDSIPGCLKWARQFHDLLSCKAKGSKKLASVFNSQIREFILRGYEQAGAQAPPPDYDFGKLYQLIGTADLIANPGHGVQFRITTDVLIGGLWWQLGQKLSGSANIRTCRHCGMLFETGPGTERHIDANFCCDDHKVKYFSLDRSRRKQAGRSRPNNRPR